MTIPNNEVSLRVCPCQAPVRPASTLMRRRTRSPLMMAARPSSIMRPLCPHALCTCAQVSSSPPPVTHTLCLTSWLHIQSTPMHCPSSPMQLFSLAQPLCRAHAPMTPCPHLPVSSLFFSFILSLLPLSPAFSIHQSLLHLSLPLTLISFHMPCCRTPCAVNSLPVSCYFQAPSHTC